MLASPAHLMTWLIAGLGIAGVIIRPFRVPEALWAVLAALTMMLFSLISLPDAGKAVLKGLDVYLFLTGMMLLAELARHEGLFDWLAALAVQRSKGSATRLFGLVYLVGTIVTIFLSNDATAVVLTPAVYAAAKRAKAEPLPYLLVCALIANAASFVLPISNPANLVVYGGHMPALKMWMSEFALASLASIVITFIVLRFTQRAHLTASLAGEGEQPRLSIGGRMAGVGILLTGALLLIASTLNWQLGLPTFVAGVLTTVAIVVLSKVSPKFIASDISWSVLPLVAGLFVLVQAVENTGVLRPLSGLISANASMHPSGIAWLSGSVVAILCNLLNNLPLGLIVGTTASSAHLTSNVTGALLIGVDLGPNLSVTGSLATILWLVALRREGQAVSAWQFLKLGSLVMPSALIAALGVFIVFHSH